MGVGGTTWWDVDVNNGEGMMIREGNFDAEEPHMIKGQLSRSDKGVE